MNVTLLNMAIVKTVIIYLMIYCLAEYIPPLRIITCSFYIGSTIMYMILKAIYNGTINPNQFPYIGFIFIMADRYILSYQ